MDHNISATYFDGAPLQFLDNGNAGRKKKMLLQKPKRSLFLEAFELLTVSKQPTKSRRP